MIDEQIAKQIEPHVRAIIRDVIEAKRFAQAAGNTDMDDILYSIEYKLGDMLPPIHGTLHLPLGGVTLGTITVRAE